MTETMTLDALKRAALRFVNERRKEAGLRGCSKVSKGYPNDSLLNPIAQSLTKVGVLQATQSGESVWLSGREGQWRRFVDPHAARFMREFDQGQFPDLEIPPTPVKIKGVVV